MRCGVDIYWDLWNYTEGRAGNTNYFNNLKDQENLGLNSTRVRDWIAKMKAHWESLGHRVHISERGYHSDAAFALLKPGAIISLYDVQKYEKLFPGWDVCYLPDQSWEKIQPFLDLKEKNLGKWWLQGEEQNDKLTYFINEWLGNWVGYVEETVFDVNMLSLD